MSEPTKYLLPESEIPTTWVNLIADLPGQPPPPLHPGTKEPLGPEDLAPIFPMALIEQEVSGEPEIEIPDEVREIYALWRPTPLHPRAAPGAGARYPGAHLLQVRGGLAGRLAQAEHRRRAGLLQQAGGDRASSRPRPAPGSGARRWRSPASMFDLECEVFMVGVSYDQKPYRRAMMETWGATVHRSPSELTEAGRSQAEHSTGQPRDRDLGGGRGGGAAARTPTTRSARC